MKRRCLAYIEKTFPHLEGQSFLITGSSNGIGLEAAKALLLRGAKVTFMVRNEGKTRLAIERIEKELGQSVLTEIVLYDQADPSSIQRCVESLKETHYDGIALNAGIYFPKKGSVGKWGMPMTLQVNAVGTRICFDCLFARYPDAKYVFVTSLVASSPSDISPYFQEDSDRRMKEYAISKAIVEAICLGALEKGAKAYLTHPGIAKTGIINGFAPWIKRLANGLFYPFSHPVFKASMGIVSAFALDYPSGALLAPRGLLEISGYPKQKKRKLKGARIKQSWEALFERLSSQHEWKHSW